MTMQLELTRRHKSYDGEMRYYTHASQACQGDMKFTIYLPPQALSGAPGGEKFPVVYWLSGLTCNEETFMTEGGGAQAHAKKHGLILVAPDTSPRGTGIAGEDDEYDLGSGASFYVDATQPKWSKYYRMETYLTRELRQIVESNFPVDPKRSGISGHSMGGHGALVLGLRHPDLYRSITALAPICAPSQAPWGIKAFTEYFGEDRSKWAAHDALEILKTTQVRTPVFIDQGLQDEYLATELFTDEFEKVVKSVKYPAILRRQPGYDHGYYFVSSFIADHLAFHAENLG